MTMGAYGRGIFSGLLAAVGFGVWTCLSKSTAQHQVGP
jgi:hypothetical protein